MAGRGGGDTGFLAYRDIGFLAYMVLLISLNCVLGPTGKYDSVQFLI